jgi:Zn-dependent protease with chaperone function
MVRQNRISIAIVVTSILLFVGCAPAQYMPQFDDSTLRAKQREISNQTERVPHTISEDPSSVLSRIYNRLEPRARELCITNGEKWLDSSCSNWRVQVLDDENFNAYATPNHEIVFTTEVFRYTKSDDELAFILAHEMGHHILNHAMEDAVNAEIMGATTGLLSGILMGAIASGLGASESTVSDLVEGAIEDGYESGRQSGRLTYSIDQESEADKLALQLIELADYSQAEARDIMLFIGADSNDLRSKHNASHPSGAERLAAFDLYASLPSDRSYSVSTSSNSVVIKKIKHTYPSGGYESDLIQVKLNSSTEYSCMYVHDRIWVALNVFQVPRRVCPKYVDWPAKDSTKIFDMTQTGTNLNAGASLKLNKGSSNSNVCAYSVLYSEADLLIPKGSGAVCPQKYGF